MAQRFDVAVLGAGIVGVSAAIHLRRAGLSVVLVDRRRPGDETSFGNAGIIQREGVHPYVFPRSLSRIAAVALGRRTEARLQWSSLPAVAPFLWRYFRASAPHVARRTFEANAQLFARCLSSHETLAQAAGAGDLISRRGWVAAFRSSGSVRNAARQLEELRELGLDAALLGPAELAALEPHLDVSRLEGAAHYRDPWAVSDPGELVKAYARLFEAEGGAIVEREVAPPGRAGPAHDFGGLVAERVVVALGPWSKPFLDAMGLVLPMGLKRGYHRHFRAKGGATLARPVVDEEHGFVLAPMSRGIRLTSGAEFARLDAPARPVQIERALPLARQLFALEDALDAQAWLGARPVFPDLRPVIGPAPGLAGVWLDFGHAHHGLTLGPASGELLAAMMTGGEPFMDPAPFSASRFVRGD